MMYGLAVMLTIATPKLRPSIQNLQKEKKSVSLLHHSSLLSVFGLNATSPYDSYLPLIFGKFALI
jgi:hypothetical protein